MSDINYQAIDETFPIAGQDNDTQTFRDNFDSIKENFRLAKEEIEDLQNNTARTDQTTAFNNNIIEDVVLRNANEAVFDYGDTLATTREISLKQGGWQIFELTDNTIFELAEFPEDEDEPRVGRVMLQLRAATPPSGSAYTVTFATTGGLVYKKNSGYPGGGIEISSIDNFVLVEVWRHSAEYVFLNYLGTFS